MIPLTHRLPTTPTEELLCFERVTIHKTIYTRSCSSSSKRRLELERPLEEDCRRHDDEDKELEIEPQQVGAKYSEAPRLVATWNADFWDKGHAPGVVVVVQVVVVRTRRGSLFSATTAASSMPDAVTGAAFTAAHTPIGAGARVCGKYDAHEVWLVFAQEDVDAFDDVDDAETENESEGSRCEDADKDGYDDQDGVHLLRDGEIFVVRFGSVDDRDPSKSVERGRREEFAEQVVDFDDENDGDGIEDEIDGVAPFSNDELGNGRHDLRNEEVRSKRDQDTEPDVASGPRFGLAKNLLLRNHGNFSLSDFSDHGESDGHAADHERDEVSRRHRVDRFALHAIDRVPSSVVLDASRTQL